MTFTKVPSLPFSGLGEGFANYKANCFPPFSPELATVMATSLELFLPALLLSTFKHLVAR